MTVDLPRFPPCGHPGCKDNTACKEDTLIWFQYNDATPNELVITVERKQPKKPAFDGNDEPWKRKRRWQRK